MAAGWARPARGEAASEAGFSWSGAVISSGSTHLILGDPTLRAWRKDSKTAGRRLPRGPRPDHLWSQSAPNKQEVGRAPTFPARPRQRGSGRRAATPGLSPRALAQPRQAPPEHCPRLTAFRRHKRGNRGTHAQREAELSLYRHAS